MAIVYEFGFRPEEKRHRPWLDRVEGQMRQAYRLLEAEMPGESGGSGGGGWLAADRPTQADVDAAVAWAFTRQALSAVAPGAMPDAADHPRLAALAARAEALPAFRAAPAG